MRHETLSSGAERGAQRQVAAAADAAGKLQVGEIGAGHEQHRRNGEDEREVESGHLKFGIRRGVNPESDVAPVLARGCGDPVGNRLELTLGVGPCRPGAQTHQTHVELARTDRGQRSTPLCARGGNSIGARRRR